VRLVPQPSNIRPMRHDVGGPARGLNDLYCARGVAAVKLEPRRRIPTSQIAAKGMVHNVASGSHGSSSIGAGWCWCHDAISPNRQIHAHRACWSCGVAARSSCGVAAATELLQIRDGYHLVLQCSRTQLHTLLP
jgi:hypothetical protein